MRASKTCSYPSCPQYQPCPEHAPIPWQGSTRKAKVKNGWAQQREARQVMRRDDTVCHWCKLPGSEEVDHVIPLSEMGADTMANKAPIHKRCHVIKTQDEARRGRERGSPV